jgi:hypothetical protein
MNHQLINSNDFIYHDNWLHNLLISASMGAIASEHRKQQNRKSLIKYSGSMDLDLLSFLVKQNILFLDPVERTIKPQSQLSLLAIRGVLKDV